MSRVSDRRWTKKRHVTIGVEWRREASICSSNQRMWAGHLDVSQRLGETVSSITGLLEESPSCCIVQSHCVLSLPLWWIFSSFFDDRSTVSELSAWKPRGNQGTLTDLTSTFHSSEKRTTRILSFSRKEAEELKLEVAKWRVAEAAARDKLLSITQLNQSIAVTNATTHAQQNLVQSSPTSTRTLSPPPVRAASSDVTRSTKSSLWQYRPITKIQEAASTDERFVTLKKIKGRTNGSLRLFLLELIPARNNRNRTSWPCSCKIWRMLFNRGRSKNDRHLWIKPTKRILPSVIISTRPYRKPVPEPLPNGWRCYKICNCVFIDIYRFLPFSLSLFYQRWK